MVRRWRIRSKLLVAMTLLMVTVSLLAFSGFWGLNHYRDLTKSIGQRATEIPLANNLDRLALTLRESNSHHQQIRAHEGMIDTSALGGSLFDIAQLENQRFKNTLTKFHLALGEYETEISAPSDTRSLLVDFEGQQKSLAGIRQCFESLDAFLRSPPAIEASRRVEIKCLLDTLVKQTEDHLNMIHSGMSDFSRDVRGQYRTWITIAWTCSILAILMGLILLAAFRSLVVKPFRTLLVGSRLVASGEFHHIIDLGTGDELSELAETMNQMTKRFRGALGKVNVLCDDLDRQVQARTREVIQNEQLASVGFLAAGVAHEINNPLATIAWSAESLQSRVGELAMVDLTDSGVDDDWVAELSKNLRRIEDEAFRCKGITEKLLDFSRLSEVRRAPTDLSELVRDVVEMVGTVGKYRCKTLHVEADQAVVAHVNPQEVRQVVLNLVTNALESVDTDGAVDIRVASDGEMASVVVQDNGCGMSQEVMKHLFEPFFTRRRDGTGTGLGLSITYRIISQHGGSLTPYSDGEGQGTQMEMILPLEPESEDITASHRLSIEQNRIKPPQASEKTAA